MRGDWKWTWTVARGVVVVGLGLDSAGCTKPGQDATTASYTLTAPSPMSRDGIAAEGNGQRSVSSDTERLKFAPSAAATNTARTLNGVKFAPQVPPGDWSKTMSCGPAALNMATAYLWGLAPQQETYIPKICGFLGKKDINNCLPNGTTTADLARAAKAVNNAPNTYSAAGWSIKRLQQEIDSGRPVVVAVTAGKLPNRGYSYAGGHFVLVVGYDGRNVICHDPGTSGGAFKYYANADFTEAMRAYDGAVVVAQR